jgi:hypothetical protein
LSDLEEIPQANRTNELEFPVNGRLLPQVD